MEIVDASLAIILEQKIGQGFERGPELFMGVLEFFFGALLLSDVAHCCQHTDNFARFIPQYGISHLCRKSGAIATSMPDLAVELPRLDAVFQSRFDRFQLISGMEDAEIFAEEFFGFIAMHSGESAIDVLQIAIHVTDSNPFAGLVNGNGKKAVVLIRFLIQRALVFVSAIRHKKIPILPAA